MKDPQSLSPSAADPILPLGEAGRDIKVPPGSTLKNAPPDYFHGSAGAEVAYWKRRAEAAEARLSKRLEEIEEEKKQTSNLVVIESPYAGDVARNVAYLGDLLKDSLERGEYPYASHRFFPGILDDLVPAERQLGIEAGLAWAARGGRTVMGMDLGISRGMEIGLSAARTVGRPVEERRLEKWKK